MYEAHFGLASLPFCTAPDSHFYVDAAPHRAAIRALQDRLGHGDDFMPLIGEFGAGKTVVGRRMLQEVGQARHVAAELPRVRMDGDQLFDRVAEAFGMRRAGAVPPLGSVIRQLEDLVRDGCEALLLVDEAHELDVAALRRLRKLAAVRVEGRSALRVCLVGRSTPPDIEQLQRIGRPLNVGAPVCVEPLDVEGTHDYILERLGRAGWAGRPAFDPARTAAIHECCQGNPGRVNRLCGHILLELYIQGRDDVNVEVVHAVDELLRAEMNGEPATLALPPLARANPDPDVPMEAVPAAVAAAPPSPVAAPPPPAEAAPPMRSPVAEVAASPQAETMGARRVEPRRRGLAQGAAALALLVSGGFLWQTISNLAAARSAPTWHAALMQTARTSPPAITPQTLPTVPPAPAATALAAMAEQALARSPPGAGSTLPAGPAPMTSAARPVAALEAPRSTARHIAAAGGRAEGRRPALPAAEPRTRSTPTASASPVGALAACTLEGETLGLCTRSHAREPVPATASTPMLEPASDPPAEAARTSPSPICEPARAALGLCPDGPRTPR